MLGLEDAADVDTRRGYGDPSLHAMSNPMLCEATVQRRTLPEAMGLLRFHNNAAVVEEDSSGIDDSGSESGSGAMLGSLEVGALRLSANGYEGWILDGAMDWMKRSPPGVVLVEFAPAGIRRSGYTNPEMLLRKLHELGYSYIAHAGPVCDGRWKDLAWAVNRGHGSLSVEEGSANLQSGLGDSETGLKQHPSQYLPQESTWCRLKPESFRILVEKGTESRTPENILFIHKSNYASAAAMEGSNG